MQTVLRIFHLKADKMRQLYQQLRNKYQMHCAYAQGNAKMREAYNKWRDPRRRQWSNTRYARYAAFVPDSDRLRLKDVPVRYEYPARAPERQKSKGRDEAR